jgi:hypothetical protein
MARVATDEERRVIDGHRLRNWLSSKDYAVKEELYFSMLATVTGLIGDRDGNADARVLMDLLAITLECDATFRGWLRKHCRNSDRLRTAEGWRAAATGAAALVIERYGRREPAELPSQGRDEFMLTREELIERVRMLIQLATTTAEEAQTVRAGLRGVESFTPPVAERPDLLDGLEARLVAVLEREMLIVMPTGEDLGIPEDERDREVAKRALVRLRTRELRTVAREQGVAETGTVEQVAQRIAEKHNDNEAEIAELVLRHEEDVPERGYVTRLVGLWEEPNVPQAGRRLEALAGNYVRVGVARWFVCTCVTANDHRVRVEGLLRYYHVNPKLEYDEYSIASTPQEAEVLITFRHGVKWIDIDSRVGGDTRALGLALQQAAGLKPREYLPIELKVPEGDLYAMHRRTVLMLSLLSADLMDGRFALLDLKLAHFEAGDDGSDNPRRPTVRSVRLGGQHLLSSRQACELIVEGRALLSLSGTLRVQLSKDERVVCPIRIELADGHATIYTGFSLAVTEQQTRRVHEELVDRVRKALERAQLPDAVVVLAPQIADRARGENPDVADILPPPPDHAPDGDGDGDASPADGSTPPVPSRG